MTSETIKQRISSLVSHFTFEYKGFDCGIDPISPAQFDVWCGDKSTTLENIDDVMNYPYFVGKALKDIAGDINIIDK